MSAQPHHKLVAGRLNKGLTIREAAEAIGVSRDVLQRAELGGVAQPRHAKRIADFYDLMVTDIWPVEDFNDEPNGDGGHTSAEAAA